MRNVIQIFVNLVSTIILSEIFFRR